MGYTFRAAVPLVNVIVSGVPGAIPATKLQPEAFKSFRKSPDFK